MTWALYVGTVIRKATKGLIARGVNPALLATLSAVGDIVDNIGGGRHGSPSVRGVTGRGLARLTGRDRETLRQHLGDLEHAGLIVWHKSRRDPSESVITVCLAAIQHVAVDWEAYAARRYERKLARMGRIQALKARCKAVSDRAFLSLLDNNNNKGLGAGEASDATALFFGLARSDRRFPEIAQLFARQMGLTVSEVIALRP